MALLALTLLAALGDGGTLDDLVPPVLVAPSPAAWPADAGAGGEVDLRLTIDEAGQVAAVEVAATVGEPFTSAALDAARALRFEPARLDGGAVRVVLAYRYRFEAPRPPPAPAAVLTGVVMTRGTRDPVPLAQLSALDAGVESDATGRFTLPLPAAGPVTVTVAAPGHRARAFSERVQPGQQLDVVYRLERTVVRPYETVVRGQADRAELARVSLSGAELHEVAGTASEPLRVIMLLPGVVTPVSGLNYPVVRGALPAATGFFLDGVRVPQLYHLLVGTSVVHPDFIEAIDFFPSNVPIRFGRLSGGVVSAQVARARDDRVHVTVSPDLLQTSAFVEVPIPSTGTSVTLGGHINYAAWLLALIQAAGAFGETRPVVESYDYQARVEQKVGTGSVRLLAFGSSDRVGATQPAPSPSVYVTSRFHRVDLRGQFPLGPGTLEAGTFVGWETLGLLGEQDGARVGAFLLERFVWTARLGYRVDVTPALQLKAGADLERQVSDVESTTGVGEGGSLLRQPRVFGTFTGAYVEAALQLGAWSVVGGVRLDTWHLPPDFTLVSADPRLDVRVSPVEALTLRASAGLAHQAPLLLISLPVSDTAALRTGLQEVAQLSLGATARLPWRGLELSGEVFYNHFLQVRERSLTEFVTGISSLDDRFNGSRTGRAYGLELMLRLPQQGQLFGWVTYSLMRSERLRRYAVFSADQAQVTEATAMLPFVFDQAHSLNVVVGTQFPGGWKLGATFHFNTGRPESGEFSSRTARVVDGPLGRPAWSPVPLSEVDRLPAFARLDVRASKTFTFPEATAELYLDVFNVLLRQEVYGYTYSSTPDGVPLREVQAFPVILPTLGVKVVY